MTMIETNTIDPMIAMQEERDYLLARVNALEQIILDQSVFNFDVEYVKFCRIARAKWKEHLLLGWDSAHDRFRHGNLQKRWQGWLACAEAREVKR